MTKSYVSVQFQEDKYDKNNFNSRHYDYLSLDDAIEVGDLVVVETKFGYKVAKVSKIKKFSNLATAYIVQKIDISAVEKEKEKIERREEIEKELKERLELSSKYAMYQELAKLDKVAADLLKELAELQ